MHVQIWETLSNGPLGWKLQHLSSSYVTLGKLHSFPTFKYGATKRSNIKAGRTRDGEQADFVHRAEGGRAAGSKAGWGEQGFHPCASLHNASAGGKGMQICHFVSNRFSARIHISYP